MLRNRTNGGVNIIGKIQYELFHFIRKRQDKAVEKTWYDIKKVVPHKQINQYGIDQQAIFLQTVYLQQIGSSLHRLLAYPPEQIPHQFLRAFSQVGHTLQIGSYPVAIKFEKRIKCHQESEIHSQYQIPQNIIVRQEECHQQPQQTITLEVYACQINHTALATF